MKSQKSLSAPLALTPSVSVDGLDVALSYETAQDNFVPIDGPVYWEAAHGEAFDGEFGRGEKVTSAAVSMSEDRTFLAFAYVSHILPAKPRIVIDRADQTRHLGKPVRCMDPLCCSKLTWLTG